MRKTLLYALSLAVLAAAAAVGPASDANSGTRLRIGLVLQNTGANDPFQHGAFVGLQRAARAFAIEPKVVVPRPGRSSVPSFAYLARQHYDLIVALGFLEAYDLDTAALKFPSSRFAIVDASLDDLPHRPPNVLGTRFKTEEAGYLAGYLAALVEDRRPGRHVIGSIGGLKIPTVDAFIAGYQAGARAADPRIELLNAYSGDFLVQEKCRAVALQQIAAGAGVVFQVASTCGLGALAAAKEKHVWGIGVDIDESFLGPQVLTSVVKRLDVAVFATIESFRDGRFRTGHDEVFDLANGGVGLGKISPRVPSAFLRRLNAIRARIVAGKIEVPATLGRG